MKILVKAKNFNNFSAKLKFYDGSNKLVVGEMKDETTGVPIKDFYSIWVFFYDHSQFTGQQGKWKAISLTPLYLFHMLPRHLNISRMITAESSPLHIASSWIQSRDFCFLSASI